MSAAPRAPGGAGTHPLPVALRVGLWISLSAACFAVLVGIVRHLSAEVDVFVITFWRNILAVAIFAPWLMRVGWRGLATRRSGLLVTRSAFLVVSSICMFFAVVLMPLAEATALSFTTPLFATLLAALVLKEAMHARRWSALIVGFVGVLVMLRPGAAAMDPAAGLVLFSALTFAAVVITGKMLAHTESPEAIVVYVSLYSIPLSLIPALIFWQWPSGEQWLWLLALGIVASGNMYGISRALRIADASLSQPFDFVRLLFTALVGYFAFAEQPDQWTWIGAAIILASSVYITHREARVQDGP